MQAYTANRPADKSFLSYEAMADTEARASYNADQQRYPAHHDDADHTDSSPLPLERLAADWQRHMLHDAGAQLTSDKLYFPRPGASVRYAHYFGFAGYLTVDADMRPLFRTSGTSWLPVSNFSELIILAEVGDFECALALDHAAGDLASITCSRQHLEVA
jgi:hypothetical protein